MPFTTTTATTASSIVVYMCSSIYVYKHITDCMCFINLGLAWLGINRYEHCHTYSLGSELWYMCICLSAAQLMQYYL